MATTNNNNPSLLDLELKIAGDAVKIAAAYADSGKYPEAYGTLLAALYGLASTAQIVQGVPVEELDRLSAC